MSSQSHFDTTPSVRAGSNAEAAVLELVPELRYEPGDDPETPDAVVECLLTPSDELPFVGICLLEVGTHVEIKSVSVVVGEAESRGRFQIRERQHQALLEAAGSYLFAVCEPRPERPIIAAKVVPATIVDELVPGWITVDDDSRSERAYAQLAWSRVFAVSEVES